MTCTDKDCAFHGELTLDNISTQICSPWLKDQVRKILIERNELKARLAPLILPSGCEAHVAEVAASRDEWDQSHTEDMS